MLTAELAAAAFEWSMGLFEVVEKLELVMAEADGVLANMLCPFGGVVVGGNTEFWTTTLGGAK